jgi:hypothetical protein
VRYAMPNVNNNSTMYIHYILNIQHFSIYFSYIHVIISQTCKNATKFAKHKKMECYNHIQDL